MRTLQDAEGRTWDVTIGRESWGTLVLIFSRRDAPENRTAALAADSARQAEAELAALDDDALRERLAGSKPWE